MKSIGEYNKVHNKGIKITSKRGWRFVR